jgi:hypothetical protein
MYLLFPPSPHHSLALRRRQAIKDSGQLADEVAARIKQAHTKYRDKYTRY